MCVRPRIYYNDPIITALNVMAGRGRRSPYRVVVVDEKERVRGLITGRRVLEVLLGRRGASLMASRGVKGMLRENVGLFMDEPRPVFNEHMPPAAALQYMAENKVGFVIVVDDNMVFQGTVDDATVLSRLRGAQFGIPVKDVMSTGVFTVESYRSLMDAASLMTELRVRRLPVVDEGRLKGILTVTDLLNHLLMEEKHVEMLLYDVSLEEVFKDEVGKVMKREVMTISPDDDIGAAAELMINNDVSGLPVVSDHEGLVGLVSRIDVLSGLIRRKGTAAVLDAMVAQLVC